MVFALLLVPLLFVSVAASAGETFDLGKTAYEHGDYATARQVFRSLAEQGHAGAQNFLGVMHHHGRGVDEDDREAAKWHRRAAGQGNARAQFLLGLKYFLGEGVERNYVQARLWLKLAAAGQPPGLERDVTERILHLVERRMTLIQIAEAQRLARQWTPQ